MEKIILAFVLLSLVGCGADPIKFTTDVKETLVPVLYSPKPPVIKQPELPIHQMTEAQEKEDGEVAKYYKATVKVLMGYSVELQKALDEYDKINKAYETKRKQIEAKIATKKAAKQAEPVK